MSHTLGIDLGTTNCSLAISRGEMIEDYPILQAVGESLFEERLHLPSFLLTFPNSEVARYENYPYLKETIAVAGEYARDVSRKASTRVIQSAKSWISLGSSRSSMALLPLDPERGEDSGLRGWTPVEAQAAYLKHLLASLPEWFDKSSAQAVVTIPASFSEYSRHLTLEAAKTAGIDKLFLLEEPQAAFYNWLYYQDKKDLDVSSVLVIDIGGGTTDFSLLTQKEGQWTRKAVGNHLLLGGDNIDLAMALSKEKELGRKFSSDELAQALSVCRDAKEKFLGGEEGRLEAQILASGSSLFAQEIQVAWDSAELRKFVLEGFFPACDFKKLENFQSLESGLREFGLPYEKNPRMTEHLADFLYRFCPDGPQAVLFHGGTLLSPLLKERYMQCFEDWFGAKPRVLNNPDPRLGVSHGACIYGLYRQGHRNLIQSGLAHNLFLKMEGSDKKEIFYCVGKVSQKEGEELDCLDEFQLKGNRQVSFPLYQDNGEHSHELGETLSQDAQESLIELPALLTTIDSSENFVPVSLCSELQSTGEILLSLNNHRENEHYQLRFALSGQGAQSQERDVVKAPVELAQQFEEYYSRSSNLDKKKVRGLVKQAEKFSSQKRSEFGADFCRFLAKSLIEKQSARRKSEVHEASWFNATGFFLRPGYGHPLDESLIDNLDYANFTQFPKSAQNRIEYWVFLRRIAGGLSESFQTTLYDSYGNYVFRRKPRVKLPGGAPSEKERLEMLQCFSCFEFLSSSQKTELSSFVLDQFYRRKLDKSQYWIISRLLDRKLFYADITKALPAQIVNDFLRKLASQSVLEKELENVVYSLISRNQNRYESVDQGLVEEMSSRLNTKEQKTEQEEEKIHFGEVLPLGLKLVS